MAMARVMAVVLPITVVLLSTTQSGCGTPSSGGPFRGDPSSGTRSGRIGGACEAEPQRPLGRPLTNMGNTCFMNAVLQAMAHTSWFRQLGCESFNERDSVKLDAWKRHIRGVFVPGVERAYKPQHMYDVRGYAGTAQQDAGELFRSRFLDEAPHEKGVNLNPKAYTLSPELFGVAVFTERHTVAGEDNDEDKVTLILNIEHNGQKYHEVGEALGYHYGNYGEEVDLRRAGGRVPKAISITKTSNVFVVELKRYKEDDYGTRTKVGHHVTFPDKLPLDVAGKTERFHLRAVVVHGGGLNGGHYYAFVRTDEGDWFRMDDSAPPSKVDWNEVERAHATLLFYEKGGGR